MSKFLTTSFNIVQQRSTSFNIGGQMRWTCCMQHCWRCWTKWWKCLAKAYGVIWNVETIALSRGLCPIINYAQCTSYENASFIRCLAMLFFIYNILYLALPSKTMRATSPRSTCAHFSRRPNAQMSHFIFWLFPSQTIRSQYKTHVCPITHSEK